MVKNIRKLKQEFFKKFPTTKIVKKPYTYDDCIDEDLNLYATGYGVSKKKEKANYPSEQIWQWVEKQLLTP
jgi:hypothetical protein